MVWPNAGAFRGIIASRFPSDAPGRRIVRPAGGNRGQPDATRHAPRQPMGRRQGGPSRRAGLLLYRSNLLGADKRITNYGGGNTSAKVMEPDPLTGETRRGALGQGLGRRCRDDQARRFRHPLHGQAQIPEAPLQGRRGRGPHGGILAPLDLQPEHPRRVDRYPAARLSALQACRPHAPGRHHRDCGLRELARADARDLRRRDRLAALAAAGLPARSRSRGVRRAHPEAKGVVLESHGLFTWADTAKECYALDLAHHQPGDRLVREADRRETGFRRPCDREPAPRGAAQDRRAH